MISLRNEANLITVGRFFMNLKEDLKDFIRLWDLYDLAPVPLLMDDCLFYLFFSCGNPNIGSMRASILLTTLGTPFLLLGSFIHPGYAFLFPYVWFLKQRKDRS